MAKTEGGGDANEKLSAIFCLVDQRRRTVSMLPESSAQLKWFSMGVQLGESYKTVYGRQHIIGAFEEDVPT